MPQIQRTAPAWIAAFALVLMGLAQSVAAQSSLTAGTLALSGQGEVRAAPDQATITLGVVTQADSAAEALSENTARLTQVFAVLDGAGIAEKDRQTSGFSINPIWERQRSGSDEPPRIVGHTVTNTVTVLVRDLDSLGGVLDAVVREGGNRFQGLSFGVSDPAPHLAAARRAAVADARAKADLYADALSVELGPILSVSESGGMRPVMMRAEAAMAMSADAMPVPIAEGEVSFSANVSITWALDQ